MKTKIACLFLCILLAFLFLGQTAPTTKPADTPPAIDPATLAEISALRTQLVDAFNKGDVNKVLSFVHPDCVATWDNAEVSHGPAGVRAYYQKMMTGPDKRVTALHIDPKTEGRQLYGDNALISYGTLGDEYTLADGSHFTLNSRFSSLLVKENGKWLIKGFHASANIFDNPVQSLIIKKVTLWTAIIAGAAGLLLGAALTSLLRRKKT